MTIDVNIFEKCADPLVTFFSILFQDFEFFPKTSAMR